MLGYIPLWKVSKVFSVSPNAPVMERSEVNYSTGPMYKKKFLKRKEESRRTQIKQINRKQRISENKSTRNGIGRILTYVVKTLSKILSTNMM